MSDNWFKSMPDNQKVIIIAIGLISIIALAMISGSTVFFIIVVIAIMSLLAFGASKEKKKLFEQGKIIERPARFFEEKKIYTTTASYEDVARIIQTRDYSEFQATCQINYNGSRMILFNSSNHWSAILDYKGVQDQRSVFEFSFLSWEMKNGIVAYEMLMNCILTDIEKTILNLDRTATVESQKMLLKTKTKMV